MDFELIFWIIAGGLSALILILAALPINWGYDPKENNPYRYCPKEEEEK